MTENPSLREAYSFWESDWPLHKHALLALGRIGNAPCNTDRRELITQLIMNTDVWRMLHVHWERLVSELVTRKTLGRESRRNRLHSGWTEDEVDALNTFLEDGAFCSLLSPSLVFAVELLLFVIRCVLTAASRRYFGGGRSNTVRHEYVHVSCLFAL